MVIKIFKICNFNINYYLNKLQSLADILEQVYIKRSEEQLCVGPLLESALRF